MQSIEHINYIKAPASDVYLALITQEGLGETWTRHLKVKPVVGHINEFEFGDPYITKMKVIELKENQQVVWECVESDEEWVSTSIVFNLFEEAGTTKIVLKHIGWRSLSDFYRWCNYNWAMFLYSLKIYCEGGKGMPYIG
jgi:uncharacterized protein YndB with AHSA1/START domain